MTVGGAVFTANRLSVQFISVSSLVTTCLKIFLSSMWMGKHKSFNNNFVLASMSEILFGSEIKVPKKDSQLPISLSFGTFGPAAANLAQQGRSPDQVTT